MRRAIIVLTSMVKINDTMKSPLVNPSKSHVSGSAFTTLILSNRAKMVVTASTNTNISTRVTVGVGGIWLRTVGTSATIDTISDAIDTMRSYNLGSS